MLTVPQMGFEYRAPEQWCWHFQKNRQRLNPLISQYIHAHPEECSENSSNFTREEDRLLAGFLVEHHPEPYGRTTDELYEKLVENVSTLSVQSLFRLR